MNTTIPETTADPIGFFESIALASLEGKEIRLSYATQRRYFGNVPFGKKRIVVEGNKVTAAWKVDFGQDWHQVSLLWNSCLNKWVNTNGAEAEQNFSA